MWAVGFDTQHVKEPSKTKLQILGTSSSNPNSWTFRFLKQTPRLDVLGKAERKISNTLLQGNHDQIFVCADGGSGITST
jgi:hypothetical protein